MIEIVLRPILARETREMFFVRNIVSKLKGKVIVGTDLELVEYILLFTFKSFYKKKNLLWYIYIQFW